MNTTPFGRLRGVLALSLALVVGSSLAVVTTSEPAVAAQGAMVTPANGHVTGTPAGYCADGSSHQGVDIARWGGSSLTVVAAAAGVVRTSKNDSGGFGSHIVIDHGNGYTTTYGHLVYDSMLVRAGATVAAGQTIGTMGTTGHSTGVHLHFEVRLNGSIPSGWWNPSFPCDGNVTLGTPINWSFPGLGSSGGGLITPGDFNGDGHPDLLSIRANGDLALYTSNGTGAWLDAFGAVVGSGWNDFSHAFSPGDFNNDGKSDVIGVLPNGDMLLYLGNGAGGWINGVGTLLATGATFASFIAPGDFNGDGNRDVIGVTAGGDLSLYRGNGSGGWVGSTGTPIGAGFAGTKFLYGAGDFSGDGKADIVAALVNGNLRMYTGNGAGGWANGTGIQIGAGFSNATRMVAPGDWDGDGHPDMIATFSDGTMKYYTGDGTGGWLNGSGVTIGSGW